MCDATEPSIPRPTVAEHTAREVGAAVEAESLQVLLDVLQLKRRVRDRLDRARTERFRAGDSPFEVGIGDLETDTDLSLLPAVTLRRLESSADEHWHEVHRSMILAGYPPTATDGRCPPEEAISAVPSGETASGRTLVCRSEQIESTGSESRLRIPLAGGRTTLCLALDGDVPPAALLADADLVHVTHHSPSALEAARSLGGALADTPAIAVLFEQSDPPRRYGDRDQGVDTDDRERLLTDLARAASLPDPDTARLLAEALEQAQFTTAERLGVCRLLAGEAGCIRLRYGTGVPRLVGAIAEIAGCELVPIPQTGAILLTGEAVPPAVESVSTDFPERQRLTEADCRALSRTLGCPPHADAAGDRSARHRATGITARLADAGELTIEDAFFLEVSPWIPRPDREAIAADVAAGRRIVEQVLALEESVGAPLATPALRTCWERAAGPDAGPVPTGEGPSGLGPSRN
jgi:hypothetical protein